MRHRGRRAQQGGRRSRPGARAAFALALCLSLAAGACGRYGPPSRYPPEPDRAEAVDGEEAGPIEGGPVETQPVEPEPQAEPLEEVPEDDEDTERRQ